MSWGRSAKKEKDITQGRGERSTEGTESTERNDQPRGKIFEIWSWVQFE